MRRTQFADVTKKRPGGNAGMPIRDVIAFDLKRLFDPDELGLAEKRVAMFNHAPMLMLAGHAIWGVSLIVHCLEHYSVGGMVLPIALLAVLLVAGGAGAHEQSESAVGNIAAHVVTRAVCVALAIFGLLWMAFTAATCSGRVPYSNMCRMNVNANCWPADWSP